MYPYTYAVEKKNSYFGVKLPLFFHIGVLGCILQMARRGYYNCKKWIKPNMVVKIYFRVLWIRSLGLTRKFFVFSGRGIGAKCIRTNLSKTLFGSRETYTTKNKNQELAFVVLRFSIGIAKCSLF